MGEQNYVVLCSPQKKKQIVKKKVVSDESLDREGSSTRSTKIPKPSLTLVAARASQASLTGSLKASVYWEDISDQNFINNQFV